MAVGRLPLGEETLDGDNIGHYIRSTEEFGGGKLESGGLGPKTVFQLKKLVDLSDICISA